MPSQSGESGGPALWSRLPPSSGRSPGDRYKHACCCCDGHVYLLGGRGGSCWRDFWRYSVVCNEWTELSCSGEAAPEELDEHSMVAHEGVLYVFGGLLDSAYTRPTSPLWLYHVAKQKWLQCGGRSSSSCQAHTPSNRKAHSAVALGSAMLLYGGLVDMKGSSQEFWRLDFDSLCWSLLSKAPAPQGPSPLGPGPRHSHSAVAHQGCMYLFGGLKGLREQRDLWRWSSGSHTWSSLRNRWGPSRLTGHSAVAYRDSMLLFGGGESQSAPQSSLWRYSFSSYTWTQVAALPGSAPPERIHHCCAGLGLGYSSTSSSSSSSSSSSCSSSTAQLQDSRRRPFKNKCFPAPLTFLGSAVATEEEEQEEEAIELETFTPKSSSEEMGGGGDGVGGAQKIISCLTFQNKAFRTHSMEEELEEELEEEVEAEELEEAEEEGGDVRQHLPDLLLVLGGRPCSIHSPISVWQMTLSES
ncbi:uncharacterized protein klhdc3l [Nelusetta ayraudi]|uniref:uncharacterized protein klhdc3l n=1 Tax=Nelusetta ayraudi TaxID=303726 RepID=UPI003F6F6D49